MVTSFGAGATKESIRQKVWTYLEDKNIAQFPRPVFNRIPNFKGSESACQKAASLEEFARARTVKVNPDKPQEHIRYLALQAHKSLLVPTPRLRSGLLNHITPPPGAGKQVLRVCASSRGVKEHSQPVGLDAKVKIDIIVIGSVAVSKQGERVGKGEGYADLEYAMMRCMGAVTEDTLVVSTVHDGQVFPSLPHQLFHPHDLTVDVICTPSQIIRCSPRLPKPLGVDWSLLTEDRIALMPILRTLRYKEEKARTRDRSRSDSGPVSPSRTAYMSGPARPENLV